MNGATVQSRVALTKVLPQYRLWPLLTHLELYRDAALKRGSLDSAVSMVTCEFGRADGVLL